MLSRGRDDDDVAVHGRFQLSTLTVIFLFAQLEMYGFHHYCWQN